MRASLLRLLLLPLALLLTIAVAQQTHPPGQVRIYDDSKLYKYLGCYNETTEVPGSDGSRALPDGIDEVRQGEMTVPMCLAFCANGRTQYRYAGLQWSRSVPFSPSLALRLGVRFARVPASGLCG
ncbi:hypothetical protein HIM_07078 [Hirsutella minnesotensis 3608]|uniref:WSC domain-containing protein n=1 Tax=Hirsutella minnesotensis 3608 TaxID=1043627 RepID=A0A0F7ZZ33_9HYPO|nr:hypothetical protein HIM_07078 [Hirsutella minnesotensis 3608]